MAKTKTYNLSRVKLVVGSKEITGSGDSEKVTFAPKSPRWVTKVDAVGNGTREANNDLSGTISVTVHQTNPDCAYLDGLFADAENSANPDFIGISMNDLSGKDQHSADECTASDRPEGKYSKSAGDRVFKFETAYLKMQFGGNN